MNQPLEAQIRLEEESYLDTFRKMQASDAKLLYKACPRFDLTHTGSALLMRAVQELGEFYITDFKKRLGRCGKPGQRHHADSYSKWVKTNFSSDPYGLAYIVVSTTMSTIHTIPAEIAVRKRLATAAIKEYEARLFAQLHPGYYKILMNRLNKTPSAIEKRKLLTTAFVKDSLDIRSEESYAVPDRYVLGQWLLLSAVKVLPWLFSLERIPSHRPGHKRTVVCMSAQVEDKQDYLFECMVKSSIVDLPMVVQPIPYTEDGEGGYITRPAAPVKRDRAEVKWDGQWLKAMHGVQDTPWQVDLNVLSTMQTLIKANHSCLPTYDIPEIAKPDTDDKESPEWKSYRSQCRARHEKIQKNKGKRIGMLAASDVAMKFAKYPAIYFPQQADFRGRAYSRPTELGPQGADYSKGLLRFAKKKPLGDRGAYWLAVHLANLNGIDKVTFDERVKWTHENSDRICRWASQPQAYMGWLEADKPWQTLLAAQDWKGLCDKGESYESSLPIAMDGSNNGLQHLSAILRDEVGSFYVNMHAGTPPQDVYGFIAGKLEEWLQEQRQKGGLWTTNKGKAAEKHYSIAQMAATILEMGVDRKLLKRPTMTYAYNATPHSMGDYLRSDDGGISARVENGAKLNDFSEFILGHWLATPVYRTISSNLRGAGEVMSWLGKAAVAIVNAGHTKITFDTPCGFRFNQSAMYSTMRASWMRFIGKRYKFYIPDGENPKASKARTSFAPNLVHSMDASHMWATIDRLQADGLDSFAMVHDSYGVHACDVDILHTAIRESFVDLYKDYCPMKALTEAYPDVDFPDIPTKGTYQIESVLDAPYFFA